MTTTDTASCEEKWIGTSASLLCDFNTFHFSLVPDPVSLCVDWSQTMSRFPLFPPRSLTWPGLTYVFILAVFS